MIFFNDINLYIANCNKKHLGFSSHFPLYYGIQYNHAGKLYLRTNKKHEFKVNGSYAFISHPGTFFEYGSINNAPRDHNFICFSGQRVESYIQSGLLPINPQEPLIKIKNLSSFIIQFRK